MAVATAATKRFVYFVMILLLFFFSLPPFVLSFFAPVYVFQPKQVVGFADRRCCCCFKMLWLSVDILGAHPRFFTQDVP